MNKFDAYYRYLKELKNSTKSNRGTKVEIDNLKKLINDSEKLETTKYRCTIQEDWVKAIEEGLVFVEKAVREERQFIRSNGEVVEIEKVKKVSKDSVSHLARHSNMITHVPENKDDDVIPDKLYMVEKLSDYAVYENRFLYMLLKYLETFISFRLEKIEKLRMTYRSKLVINRKLELEKRTLDYHLEMSDDIENNMYPLKDDSSFSLLERIKNCSLNVNGLLSTDLMVQVSKSPMIKPPITKTNVLKMNQNFKKSLELYDYIASYKDLGFTYEEVNKDFYPFEDKMNEEISNAIGLTSFISYKCGNEIDDILEISYQEEEERLRILEQEKLKKQIASLKKKARESNKTMEEYMLLLEKRNSLLERDSQELAIARNEIVNLNNQIAELNNKIDELNQTINNLQLEIEEKIKEINYLNQKYIEDMAKLKQEHQKEIEALNFAHIEEINSLNIAHEEEINSLNLSHEEEIERINKEHQDEIDSIELSHMHEIDDLKSQYEDQIQLLKDDFVKEKNAYIEEYESKISSLDSQIKNLTKKQKELIDDYTSQINENTSEISSLKNELSEKISTYEQRIQKIENDYTLQIEDMTFKNKNEVEELLEKQRNLEGTNTFYLSQIDALRVENGSLSPSLDYVNEQRLDELEREYLSFKKFYKNQWKLAKKELRKMILNKEEITKNNKKQEKAN